MQRRTVAGSSSPLLRSALTQCIKIGNLVRIIHSVHVVATHWVEIGDDVLLGSKVVILDHNYGLYAGPATEMHTDLAIAPSIRPLDSDKPISIGHNCWLCDVVVVKRYNPAARRWESVR